MRHGMFVTTFCMLLVSSHCRLVAAAAPQWVAPAIVLPTITQHPAFACTPEELARLREAYQGEGSEQQVVAAMVARADRAIRLPLEFPPRGGQHNQWYQCDDCQIALKTIDDTHHQCPNCQKIYSGEPYDDVIFARTHNRNLQNMETAAWAYAITGHGQYASLPNACCWDMPSVIRLSISRRKSVTRSPKGPSGRASVRTDAQ